MDSSLINLLAERFKLCREIGKFKKEHNMTVLQSDRYNEMLEKCKQQANACGIDAKICISHSRNYTRRKRAPTAHYSQLITY